MSWAELQFMCLVCLGMLSCIKRRGPLRLLVSGAVWFRAVLFAAVDFARAGRERVSRRWPEYLERAKQEL